MINWIKQILTVSSVLSIALFLLVNISVIFFPYGIDYGEGPLIDQARRITARETLYKSDLETPPYVIANYPPIYPLTIAFISKITRLHFLQTGRFISLIASLVSSVLISLFAYKLCGSRIYSLLAAAIFLGNPFVVYWSSLARVDLLALVLSLTSLWVLFRYWRSWFWLMIAIFLLVAAIYTRQSHILAVPLTGIIWLWQNCPRRAIFFITALFLMILFIFFTINLLTDNGFYLNVVVANVNNYRIERTLLFFLFLLKLWPAIVAIASVEFIKIIRTHLNHKDELTQERLFLKYGLTVYTFGAFLSALTVGKVGSNVNYLLELIAALAIWAGCAPIWIHRRQAIQPQGIFFLLLCQIVWILASSFPVYQAMTSDLWQDLSQYDELYQEVQLAAQHGPVLADDYMHMIALTGQGIYYQPFEYQQFILKRLWEPSKLVEEIEKRKFSLILLNVDQAWHEECWAKPITEAIESNYTREKTLLDVAIYRNPALQAPLLPQVLKSEDAQKY